MKNYFHAPIGNSGTICFMWPHCDGLKVIRSPNMDRSLRSTRPSIETDRPLSILHFEMLIVHRNLDLLRIPYDMMCSRMPNSEVPRPYQDNFSFPETAPSWAVSYSEVISFISCIIESETMELSITCFVRFFAISWQLHVSG
jgi:hypothetical protein